MQQLTFFEFSRERREWEVVRSDVEKCFLLSNIRTNIEKNVFSVRISHKTVYHTKWTNDSEIERYGIRT